jgi:hypothetical protein
VLHKRGHPNFHVMNTVRQSRRLGIIGSIVGLLALLISAFTQLSPTLSVSEPARHTTEAAGPTDKGRWSFRINRFEIRSHEASEPRTAGTTSTASDDWNQGLPTAAVALGLLAIVFAVFSVITREEKLLAGIAAVLGCTAIAVQIYWIVIVIVVLMVIANAIVS